MDVNLTRISTRTKQESSLREIFFCALERLPVPPASAQLAEMISVPFAVKALNLSGAAAVNTEAPGSLSVTIAPHTLELSIRRAAKARGPSSGTASMALVPGEHGESSYSFSGFLFAAFWVGNHSSTTRVNSFVKIHFCLVCAARPAKHAGIRQFRWLNPVSVIMS